MSNFVDISQSDFESWLNTQGSWFKDTSTSGCYHINLSPNVSIKINSSMTKHGTTMPNATASVTMCLWSKTLNRVINYKDADRSHFKRTSGWQNTFTDGVNHWKKLFSDKAHFYDKQIHMTEEQLTQYKIDWCLKIQSQPKWEENVFLKDNFDKIMKGFVLSPKTENAILKDNTEPLSDAQIKFKERVVSLSKASKEKGDEWTASFTQSIIDTINKFGSKTTLSDKQKQTLFNKLTKYNL
jgi:hypothetical protein